jgi:two-component system, NarL family, nitrate/nitrite response regulator NarL
MECQLNTTVGATAGVRENYAARNYADRFARRLLVVEDNTLLRSLLVENLAKAGFDVVGAASAAEARKKSKDLDPDIALLDIDLGDGPSGFHLAEVLRKSNPGISIIFLTNIPEPRIAGEAGDPVPPGAAYLRKDNIHDIESLVTTIDKVSRTKAGRAEREDKIKNHGLAKLSNSQIQALRLVALGYSNAEIASLRQTTERAVRNLLHRTYEALGIEESDTKHARVEAVRRFIEIAGKPNHLETIRKPNRVLYGTGPNSKAAKIAKVTSVSKTTNAAK